MKTYKQALDRERKSDSGIEEKVFILISDPISNPHLLLSVAVNYCHASSVEEKRKSDGTRCHHRRAE